MFLVHVVGDANEMRQGVVRRVPVADYACREHDDIDSLAAVFDASENACVVALLQPNRPPLSPVEELAARDVFVPVIMVAEVYGPTMIIDAMHGGAVDFVPYPIDGQRLIAALERARAVDEDWRWRRMRRADIETRLRRLTPREREVLDLIVAGEGNKQIATGLSRSEKTVESHRSRLMRKLEADSLAELISVMHEFNQIKIELMPRRFRPT